MDAGPDHKSGRELARQLRRRWSLLELVATLIGGFVVLAFMHAFHSAMDPSHTIGAAVAGSRRLIAYLAVALPIGWAWRERRTRRLWRWLYEGRAPDPHERELVLRAPLRELVIPATLWAGGALAFGVFEIFRPRLGLGPLDTVLIIALGGLTTCALIYLQVEWLLRPITARALAAGPHDEPVSPGVTARLITAWGLASAIPLLGLALLALGGLHHHFRDARSLAIPALVLVAAGLIAGAIATVLSARSLATPITAVRRGLARIRAGELDVRLAVDDGSEVGLLQAGFNDLAAGLRERERLRDLFGRHVGEDVARSALQNGAALGGEVRDVAALFVDLIGSTALAYARPPQEVVALLNRFFSLVVDIADAHGGWVNRFEGDGALCVFGAPGREPDPAGSALAAGRELAERVCSALPEIGIGVGISAGSAVAGNVGAERRLEYTVIGDPINEAARLCELAKKHPDRVLASAAAVALATPTEATRWQLGSEATLRGRDAPTRLASPASTVPV